MSESNFFTSIAFEKERGTLAEDARVTCALSVSVTHRGLQDIAKEYLEDELKREKNIRHLEVYVFTEADTIQIIKRLPHSTGGSLFNDSPIYQRSDHATLRTISKSPTPDTTR